MDTSEFVGMDAYDKIQEQDNVKASIRLLKEQGYSAPKQLLRILLLALSPSEMAMATSTDAVSAELSPASSFMDYKNVMIATLLTLLCGALAVCFYLRFALGVARGENFAKGMDQKLHEVLDILESKMGWGIYEGKAETLQEKCRRYLDSELCEVSDDEYWCHIHYGPPYTDEHDGAEEGSESSLTADPEVSTSHLSPELRQSVLETNAVLRSRVERLEADWERAQWHNDSLAMAQIEGQIREAHGLMYTDVDET